MQTKMLLSNKESSTYAKKKKVYSFKLENKEVIIEILALLVLSRFNPVPRVERNFPQS